MGNGLSSQQKTIINSLASGEKTVKMLARIANYTNSNIYPSLANLEEKKIIAKNGNKYHLTMYGKTLLDIEVFLFS